MTKEEILGTWDLETLKKDLGDAYRENSEVKLLSILKANSFLFYELFSRKYGIQPIFHEVSFGGGFRCDFAWLNDSSDGPEWVLVEVEKPKMRLFNTNGEPTAELNHAIEQVKSWRRYFNENPSEKKRIFGAVARFRYILIAGSSEKWASPDAQRWRIDNNKETNIEIRTSDVFIRPLRILEEHPDELWSFAENPRTLLPSELSRYWGEYEYMKPWRLL